jgi:hypothetical protein
MPAAYILSEQAHGENLKDKKLCWQVDKYEYEKPERSEVESQ